MMIVFISLAAIAVDLTAMHMAKRRAVQVISGAASDAAGMIDDRALHLAGDIRIDSGRAERVVAAHIHTEELVGTIINGPDVVVAPDGRSITVSIRLRIDHVFLRSFPSLGSDELTVRGSARLSSG